MNLVNLLTRKPKTELLDLMAERKAAELQLRKYGGEKEAETDQLGRNALQLVQAQITAWLQKDVFVR